MKWKERGKRKRVRKEKAAAEVIKERDGKKEDQIERQVEKRKKWKENRRDRKGDVTSSITL